MREAAAWVVERVLASNAPAATFLESALARCDERDHSLLYGLALGTLRWLGRLDHVISSASNRSFDQIETGLHSPLRLGAYQLLFLDGVPHHAVVHEAVEQAQRRTHRGGASFVNAVLRRIGRSPRLEDWPVAEDDPVRRLAIENSHPEFLVKLWLERFGDETTRRLLEVNNRQKPLHLLAFRDRGGRELIAEQLIDEGLEVEPSKLAPLGLKVLRGRPWASSCFRQGKIYVQDEASQVAALIPLPRPGERVLDLAASPGGKTLSALAYDPAQDSVAADLSIQRILRLRANLERLGRQVPLVVANGALTPFAGVFDRVVVDLPCSGTGTFRHKPELRWRVSKGEIDRLAGQSLAILKGAAPAVRPGGLMVVITCSIEHQENEAVVARLIEQRPWLASVDLAGVIPAHLASSIQGPGLWRLLPADDHDGFTVQVLRRSEEALADVPV